MKTNILKQAFIILLIQFLFVVHAKAQEVERKEMETFSVSDNSIVNLENKFGDIEVENWDKNSVQIEVLIKVEASSNSKAEEILKKIDISLTKTGENVFGKTNLEGTFNNVEFSINYKVKMPKNLVLNIENKFGNVFINELSNKFNIVVKYGALKINSLTGDDSKPYGVVNLQYSKSSRIDNCNYIKLELSYSKLSIGTANAIISSSKYSKLAIKEANLMVAESKYDNYKIGTINAFKTISAYADIEIEEVKQILKLSTKYTNTNIELIPNNFKKIEIVNSYGSINLGLNETAGYKLNAEAQYANINVPESKNLSKSKEPTRVKYWGIVGNNSNTDATIDIETKYGNIDLN
jgi:hypothetical protein